VACVWRGAWWAGQRAAAHQWWASYKVRIAQSFIIITTTTTWWEGACLSCTPACLLLLWQQAGGSGTARISTRPPLTAASQQDTPIHTHNTPCPAPNRAWRGAFEWRGVRLLFVLGISIISLCGRLSGRLKHCSKGSQMHTHTRTYTRTARVVWWWWWCESVQATRTKTMYRERERERE
jgi:hypothetical protein